MTAHTLPADVERCLGVGFPDPLVPGGIDWREGCDVCSRRLAPPADPARVLWIAPPLIIVFECPNLIERPAVQHLPADDSEGGQA